MTEAANNPNPTDGESQGSDQAKEPKGKSPRSSKSSAKQSRSEKELKDRGLDPSVFGYAKK